MLDSAGPSLIEIQHRRDTWSSGLPVYLADDSPWRLPIISQSLLATCPSLADDIAVSVRLARTVQGTQFQPDEAPQYQLNLLAVGLRLLQINYEMADQDWLRLLDFQSKFDIFAFTYHTAYAIHFARPVWQPFLAKLDSESLVALSYN